MKPEWIAFILSVYFGALILIARITSRNADSDTFFTGHRESPWYLVAFGMIGASLSGVTFISVPGAVSKDGFAYYQIVLGYTLGYAFIAQVLMPLYYRMNLISIYEYLNSRFGIVSYKTGSAIFLLSRTLGSAMRLYLATGVLHTFLFGPWGVPFPLTVIVTIALIWVYTFKGGIKTIVWTDTFQTFFLVSALIICVYTIMNRLDMSISTLPDTLHRSGMSRIFIFDDWRSPLFFPKQFIGGAFIAIAMTGLDQDLMQKNLTCKNLGEARKNMYSFTGVLVIVNLLFLILGALMYLFASQYSIKLPASGDEVFPVLALTHFGTVAAIFFLLGITASSYASADSALAALTTSFCIDFLDFNKKAEKQKQREKFIVHIGFSVLFLIVILITREIADTALIKLILKLAGYTYGPLLGMFFFGILSKRRVHDKFVPLVCLLAPFLCYLADINSVTVFNGYKFGLEILILNGFLTFVGMYILSKKSTQ